MAPLLFLIQRFKVWTHIHFLIFSSGGVQALRSVAISVDQGTHGTGKTGKMVKKIPCQGKHREFENFVKTQGKHREFCLNTGKTQGILFAQVVNSLILKVKDTVIFAAKISPEVG